MRERESNNWFKRREVLHPQYFYNIFTTNHTWFKYLAIERKKKENERERESNNWFKRREVLHSQYFYNIFTTNHRWIVVISSNLNLILKLLFYPNNNNFIFRICCKNIVKILWAYQFS